MKKHSSITLLLCVLSKLCIAQISFDFNIQSAWPRVQLQRLPNKLYPEGDPTIDNLRPNGLNFCSYIKISKKTYLGLDYTVQDYDRGYSYRSNQVNPSGGTLIGGYNAAFGASNPFLSIGPAFKTAFKLYGSKFFIELKAAKGYSIGNKDKLNKDWLNPRYTSLDAQNYQFKDFTLDNSKFWVSNALLKKQIPFNKYNRLVISAGYQIGFADFHREHVEIILGASTNQKRSYEYIVTMNGTTPLLLIGYSRSFSRDKWEEE